MQFALPPRKTSHPPPYARASRLSLIQRRKQIKTLAILAVALLSFLFLLFRLFFSGSSGSLIPAGTPEIVIVTVLDRETLSSKYLSQIKQNREDYAKRHGYVNFFANTSDYLPYVASAPRSWAMVPAVRHALTTYPHTTYFFVLNAHSLIMNPSLSLESHILKKDRLESLMLKDIPVVPPDSVIKTFGLRARDVDFILTQDSESLGSGSFIIRNGEWAQFFLDAWFDPLYRSYNFAKAEVHALDHISQWHPTILAKLALVPQRIMNSYTAESAGITPAGQWRNDDFLIRFNGCETDSTRNCEKEMDPYWPMWQKRVLDG